MEDPGPIIGDEAAAPRDDVASVVLVERSEDVAAVCGRIDGAPTWAVVIHAPGGNRQLSTELGMRRLIHHAEEAGKVIAIATRSGALSSRARELNVPVARKPQSIRWDAGGRHVVRVGKFNFAAPSIGRYVQVAIIVAVAFAGLFLIFAMGPSATITAYPPTETVTEVITITASESRDSVNLETLEVPASQVSTLEKFTLAAATTGTTMVGTQPAKATVTVTNDTQAAVVVAQGTIVFAAPDFFPFTFDETVTVPPAGSVEAVVTASRPGVAGNVAAAAIAGWEPERLRFLKITNAAPAAGGVSEPRPAVAPEDVASLNALAKTLENSNAVKQSLIDARPHDAVFMSTASSKVELGASHPAVGTPADVVFLEVNVSLSALAVLENTLDQVARQVLHTQAGDGEFVPGTVKAVETGARQLDADSATIRTELQVQGELARGVTRDAIRSAVKGKSEDEVLSTLSERYGIQDAEVRLSGWAPRLPRFGFRIDVNLAARPATNGSGFAIPNDTTPTTTATATATAVP
ncbi:MAG: baseplate J/gp47 family protein [Dehalococcoidia bacterium]